MLLMTLLIGLKVILSVQAILQVVSNVRSHFYNEIIRKNIVGFGTLFNGITLKKVDPSDGSVLEEEKVPLAYGPKNKFLTRLNRIQMCHVRLQLLCHVSTLR